VPEASVMRRVRTLSGFIGRIEMRRRFSKSSVKDLSLTKEVQSKLLELRQGGVNGILGGVVKYVDIERNTRGEGDSLALV
jgi:hypothetical protein